MKAKCFFRKNAAGYAAASLVLLVNATWASAATSLSNSLLGFTGNSTQTATQTAIAAAGLNFSSTAGAVEDPPGTVIDPTIQLNSSGAHFGDLGVNDGGRNYIRTNDADYANVSFVAEVTMTASDLVSQAGYFGLGSGVHGQFRIADWGTPFSAAQLFLEVNPLIPRVFTLTNDNGIATFDAGTDAPSMDSGTHRLRLTYDWFQKTAAYSIDVNYAGGAFTADVTLPSVKTAGLYGADGWPTEPARVYFGGDDGAVFKDFQVTVSTSSMRLGDFNMDGNVTAADWTILRNNQLGNLTGKTFAEAYALGDVTADLANNHADFAVFKQLYDAANGVGSFVAMAGSVPEPSTAVLILSAGMLLRPLSRRATRRI